MNKAYLMNFEYEELKSYDLEQLMKFFVNLLECRDSYIVNVSSNDCTLFFMHYDIYVVYRYLCYRLLKTQKDLKKDTLDFFSDSFDFYDKGVLFDDEKKTLDFFDDLGKKVEESFIEVKKQIDTKRRFETKKSDSDEEIVTC